MKITKLLVFFAFVSFANLAVASDLPQLQNYLNSITTLEAEFKQESDGAPRFGKLYISKPYNIKWDYTLPKKSLVLGSKNQFIYYDPRMDEVTYVPSSKVPGFFLADKNIEFGKNIDVLAHHKTEKIITIDLQDKVMKKSNIVVQLIFQRKPIQIMGLKVIDWSQQTEIIFTLNNLKVNSAMPEAVFAFKDPNFFKPNNKR